MFLFYFQAIKKAFLLWRTFLNWHPMSWRCFSPTVQFQYLSIHTSLSSLSPYYLLFTSTMPSAPSSSVLHKRSSFSLVQCQTFKTSHSCFSLLCTSETLLHTCFICFISLKRKYVLRQCVKYNKIRLLYLKCLKHEFSSGKKKIFH